MKKIFPIALMQAQELRKKYPKLLKAVPASFRNGNILELARFACEISAEGCLDFWRKGQKEKISAHLTSLNQSFNICPSLCVFKPNHRIILNELAGVNIREHFNESEDYLHTQFKWAGCSTTNSKPGVLLFARVNLSGQKFVNYEICDDYHGKVNGKLEGKPNTKEAPASIKDKDNFFNVTVKTKINFDARANEILRESGLMDFMAECQIFSK